MSGGMGGGVRWGFALCLGFGQLACGSAEPVVPAQQSPVAGELAAATAPARPTPLDADWQRATELSISHSEYRFELDSDGSLVRATNRARDFRGSFSAQGLELRSRSSAESSAFSLRLAAWGRGSQLAPAPAVEPSSGRCMQPGRIDETGECLKRLEYVRADLLEYWDNGERGLEQGWEIAAPPRGAGELVLALSVAGAQISHAPDGLYLDTGDGFRVGYNGLKAWDADQRPLVAQLDFRDDIIQIRIDDSNARYPIVVDPMLTTASWSKLSDVASDYFGNAMTGGDVNGDGYADMIVGAANTQVGTAGLAGKVYAFLGSATGLASTAAWSKDLPRTGNHGAMQLGFSLTSGDFNRDGYTDIAIGEPGAYDSVVGTQPNRLGAVHIFNGSASGLAASASLTLWGDLANSRFGQAVATGDFTGDGFPDLLVGAPNYSTAGFLNDGAAYAYLGTATGLSSTPSWKRASSAEKARFGWAVASAGDVNADGRADFLVSGNGHSSVGRAYGYLGVASGAFGTSSRAWTGVTGSCMGSALTGAGDTNGDGYTDFMVGDSCYDITGKANVGRFSLYRGSSSGFPTSATYTREGDTANEQLGDALNGAGDLDGDGKLDIAVGGYGTRIVEVFMGGKNTTSGFTSSPSYTLKRVAGADSDTLSFFGRTVAGLGDTNGDGLSDLGVGAPRLMGLDKSAVYLFLGAREAPTAPSLQRTLTGLSNQDHFAFAVAGAGDVNGDGYADVLVGAPYFDDGQPGAGKVYLYLGSSTGIAATAAWSTSSTSTDAHFGAAVAGAGDVNNDGYADVVIGAPDYSNGQAQEGRAYVYHGSTTGLGAAAAWSPEVNQIGAHHGFAVAGAGDVNGDGFADVVIGAPGRAQTADTGAIRVYHGGATGLSASAARTVNGSIQGSYFGSAVAAGDMNRDGFADVAVGASRYGNVESQEGAVFVFHGSTTGIPATAIWSGESNRDGSYFGQSIALGDINGDGCSDLLVGAPRFDDTVASNEEAGRAYLYLGAGGTGLSTASWFRVGVQEGEQLGSRLASVGDINGDGYGDFVVGAPYDQVLDFQQETYQRGRVEWFLGGLLGPDSAPTWSTQGLTKTARLSTSLAGVGDVNGDGYADVALGAENTDAAVDDDRGTVALYLGGSSTFVTPRSPQAFRTGTTTPLLPWNKAPARSFDFKLKSVRSPFGSGRLKLWIDAKPVGTAFGGGASAGAFTAVVPGTNLDLAGALSGLTAAKSYHFRARVIGDPGQGFVPSASRWFYGSVLDPQGTHFRTP